MKKLLSKIWLITLGLSFIAITLHGAFVERMILAQVLVIGVVVWFFCLITLAALKTLSTNNN